MLLLIYHPYVMHRYTHYELKKNKKCYITKQIVKDGFKFFNESIHFI